MNNSPGEVLGGSKKFVIEFVSPETGCVCDDIFFESTDVTGLSEIVNGDDSGFHPAGTYVLDAVSLDAISSKLGISFENYCGGARIRAWRITDELPYKVHTNRELALMLRGEKPLAVFCEWLPSNPEFDLIPEHQFAPHVEAGLLNAFEYIVDAAKGRKIRYVLYITSGEEWRVPAYMLLKAAAAKSGWNEGFERMEGSLLGYEDWQNDVYIEQVFRRGVGGGSPKPRD
jgi:hypothetical protein